MFHDLRRANATALVLDGVDVKTAQTRLGHSDPRLTLAVYAQASTDADRAAAALLGLRFMPSRGAVAGLANETSAEHKHRNRRDPQKRESGCRDLNPGPQRPERCALTKLRHTPLGAKGV
jgi:hypothetical protein